MFYSPKRKVSIMLRMYVVCNSEVFKFRFSMFM